MPKKVKFSVIYTTGEDSVTFPFVCLINSPPSFPDEDPDYPASELNSHGPTVHGWRSNKSCTAFPQELILKFHSPASVTSIQVLGHQFMIRR